MGANESIAEFFNELSYRGYRRSRETSPEITPQSWRQVYGADADEFERRYQDEINRYADNAIRREKETPQWLRDAQTGAREPK